ncbi:hypothetical protein BIT28_10270 [Photobacterium proteolyticum]|uniref:1-alkyl-2-acetylglycerophosphocholine esterase n=1 Tax=Photobacterium proteolyticum TaxID=1903952 RepID=A0A1Q9G6I4_9GAMM|nr:hypothetical protein [Photobacterium proteolyticum]OLQ69928.1 hypothetical protein BIT28_10270 [Photobacterium proteolyticum]
MYSLVTLLFVEAFVQNIKPKIRNKLQYRAETNENRVDYLSPALIDTYVKEGTPRTIFSTISSSWSFRDLPLPVASDSYPVLIYNHGFLTFPRFSMTQLEYLASHGYVVLAISHPERKRLIERTSGVVVPVNYTQVEFTEEEDAASIKAYFDAKLKKANSWPPAESKFYIVKSLILTSITQPFTT